MPVARNQRGTTARRPPRPHHSPAARTAARWMFHSHLWLGLASSGIVLLIAITGILLNHKRGLGLMPDPAHTAAGAFENALPLAELARRASVAVGTGVAAAGVDRMDVRPGDGIVKVRFDDRRVTEATVDLVSGEVVHIGERNDVFLEKLHSGEIFGDRWILLTDFAAVLLAALVISGYWIWLYPRSRA
jgi:uncharacterized iron-regulated membrane protein